MPLAKMCYYVNVRSAEAIMRRVRIEFPHPIRIMFLLAKRTHYVMAGLYLRYLHDTHGIKSTHPPHMQNRQKG